MARDDYHVIVYQILSYLYMQLKQGKDIDASLIRHDSKYLQINRKYWTYIIVNLLNEGYISGIVIDKDIDENIEIYNLDKCEITPKGIEYLTDNSTIEKAKRFMKDLKDILPFVSADYFLVGFYFAQFQERRTIWLKD